MLNWILVALLAVALVGIGGLAFVIDSGVEDKQKQTYVYALFGLLGLIGVVFMLVEDKSAFVYGDWESSGKKGGSKSKQHAEVSEGSDGKMAETGVTTKQGASGGDEAAGSDGGKGSKETADGRDCPVCPPMVRLNGGRTVVGTLFREAGQGGPALGPLQEVMQPAYSISRYEITVGQFEAFVKAKGHKPATSCRIGEKVVEASYRNPGFEQTPEHPVVCISWYDAAAFASWLTDTTGRRYDLATEIEWEHAARADAIDPYVTGRQIHSAQAQFRAVGPPRTGTLEIGQFSSNKFGLYDVHGNAAEMIRNCWNTAEVAVGKATGECTIRTTKGGSWSSTAAHLQFAARAPIAIGEADNTTGFRVVRHKE